MAFKTALSLFSLLVLVSSSSEFKSVECKYKLAAIPELSSSSKALELGVYAGEDLERKGVLEKQPSAVMRTEHCAGSILNNYVHGHNITHATLFFGSSSIFNHGEKNIVHNAMISRVIGKYGAPDVSLVVGNDLKKGEEMFGFYNVKQTSKDKQTTLVVDWFKDRELPYINTSDKDSYDGLLKDDSLILEGCSDNDHLKVNSSVDNGGVWTKLAVEEGDVIETNRVLLVYNRIGGDEEENGRLDDMFWTASLPKKVLSLGVVLPFAKFSNDPSVANVKPVWWKDQVFYDQDMGIISLVATRNIAADEEIVVLSNSYYYKQLPSDMAAQLKAQVSWPLYFIDLYLSATTTGLLYSAIIIGFGGLFLLI